MAIHVYRLTDDELHRAVKVAAAEARQTVTAFVEAALRSRLAAEPRVAVQAQHVARAVSASVPPLFRGPIPKAQSLK